MASEPAPQRTARLRELFAAALDLQNATERQLLVSQVCAESPELGGRLRELLEAHDQRLDNPLDDVVQQLHFDETLCSTDKSEPVFDIDSHPVVGKYKLLELIGEGGMGAVYMAQQSEPFRRRVAFKVIRPGMDSKEVIARFEAERQALAKMDHPNIARVLDAGTTDAGRPYFVMELVCGVPITTYCQRQNVGLSERLRLFITVCQAVQHAHVKGIIHRDLKPSNVLIAVYDGLPTVKIIDFGVAKALHEDLTENTLFTQFASLVGTPAYMSPEQAELGRQDVDTRSDVYSLGMLLYELVTGVPPIARETLRKADFDEVRRIIREDSPPRPSTRLTTLHGKQDATVNSAVQDHRQLTRRLRSELDWIVMTALQKDRDERYQSARELADDLMRFLNDEPVHACPKSKRYRLGKFIRRHKGSLASATLVLALLLTGLGVASQLAYRAKRAEQLAVAAQAETAASARKQQQLLYDFDMLLAAEAWREDDSRQLAERLNRHIPPPGEPDRRGFEWHFLHRQQSIPFTLLLRVEGALYDLALAPDGQRFAVVGKDAVLRIGDLAGTTPIVSVPTPQRETNGVIFTPDGQRLAVAGDDGTLRLIDAASLAQLWQVQAHPELAFHVDCAQGGRQFVTCGRDTCVRLWDSDSGASQGTLNLHDNHLEYLAVSATGLVAAGDRNARITVWDADAGTPVFDFHSPRGTVSSALAWSSTGHLAHGTIEGDLYILDSATHSLLAHRRLPDGVQSLAFAPDGSWLAAGDRNGNLRIIPFEAGLWDLDTSRTWPAHRGRVFACAVTSDGRRLLSAGEDGCVRAWELWASSAHKLVGCESETDSLAVLDDQMLVVGVVGGIELRDRLGNKLRDLTRQPGTWEVSVARSVRQVCGVTAGEIVLWSVDDGRELFRQPVETGSHYRHALPTPDGRTVCALSRDGEGDFYLDLFDVESGDSRERHRVRSAACCDISPDGRWFVHDSDNEIHVVDVATGQVSRRWMAHRSSLRSLSFSGDGERLASTSADRMLKVWTFASGELDVEVLAHQSETHEVALTHDGARIATGGGDRMLRIWDGRSLQLLWEYPPIVGSVRELQFYSRDGHLAALVGQRGLLILDGSPVKNSNR